MRNGKRDHSAVSVIFGVHDDAALGGVCGVRYFVG
jgi:hypothetical protein